MERKITIRILDRKFSVVAESPEQEHDMREAAESVDKKFYEYRRRLPEDDDVLLEKLRSYLGNIDEK